MLFSLGKIPTTSARRFTSLFRRSSGFVSYRYTPQNRDDVRAVLAADPERDRKTK